MTRKDPFEADWVSDKITGYLFVSFWVSLWPKNLRSGWLTPRYGVNAVSGTSCTGPRRPEGWRGQFEASKGW